MTKEQYEEYTIINDEVKQLKSFLMWCGNKYKDDSVIKCKCKIYAKKTKIALMRIWFSKSFSDNLFEVSDELQNRIIETIENYVNEKEKRLSEI